MIFQKFFYCPTRKNKCNCWASVEVGYYAKECKHRRNNKLFETLVSLDYFELSEEVLDLALKNNKEIVQIVMEDNDLEIKRL